MDEKLIKAYTETDYQILPLNLIVKIGKRSPRLIAEMISHNWTSIAIITAWNPRSVEIPHEENLTQNLKLLKDLVEEDAIVFPAVGKSKENYWKPEESWCVFSIEIEKLLELGRKYNQNAFVFAGLNEVPRLVYCFE